MQHELVLAEGKWQLVGRSTGQWCASWMLLKISWSVSCALRSVSARQLAIMINAKRDIFMIYVNIEEREREIK